MSVRPWILGMRIDSYSSLTGPTNISAAWTPSYPLMSFAWRPLLRFATVLLRLKNSMMRAVRFSFSSFSPFLEVAMRRNVLRYSILVGRTLLATGIVFFSPSPFSLLDYGPSPVLLYQLWLHPLYLRV